MIARAVNLRVEKADIRVCRPSPWGNPWKILKGRHCYEVRRLENWRTRYFSVQREACAFAVECYRDWIMGRHELVTALMQKIDEQRGRWAKDHPDEVTLGCWCVPLPCHAEVLAELAMHYGEPIGSRRLRGTNAWRRSNEARS